MLKRVFLSRFEPVVERFGPWKMAKCLENGSFWDQKRVQNGSTVRGLGYPPAAPSDDWYGGLCISLGDYEAWKPQRWVAGGIAALGIRV